MAYLEGRDIGRYKTLLDDFRFIFSLSFPSTGRMENDRRGKKELPLDREIRAGGDCLKRYAVKYGPYENLNNIVSRCYWETKHSKLGNCLEITGNMDWSYASTSMLNHFPYLIMEVSFNSGSTLIVLNSTIKNLFNLFFVRVGYCTTISMNIVGSRLARTHCAHAKLFKILRLNC